MTERLQENGTTRECPECGQVGNGPYCHHWDVTGKRKIATVQITADDPWPIAVSDGVGMPCSDCRQVPHFDYRVTDRFWREHVPEKPARLSVVCLPCLDRRCGGVGLADAIVEIQWTGTLHTVVLQPVARYEFRGHA